MSKKLDHEKENKRGKGLSGKSAYDELPPIGSNSDKARWWREHGESSKRKRHAISQDSPPMPQRSAHIQQKLGNLEAFVDAIEKRSFKKKTAKDVEEILTIVNAKLLTLQRDSEFSDIQIDPLYIRACTVVADAYRYLENWLKR